MIDPPLDPSETRSLPRGIKRIADILNDVDANVRTVVPQNKNAGRTKSLGEVPPHNEPPSDSACPAVILRYSPNVSLIFQKQLSVRAKQHRLFVKVSQRTLAYTKTWPRIETSQDCQDLRSFLLFRKP